MVSLTWFYCRLRLLCLLSLVCFAAILRMLPYGEVCCISWYRTIRGCKGAFEWGDSSSGARSTSVLICTRAPFRRSLYTHLHVLYRTS